MRSQVVAWVVPQEVSGLVRALDRGEKDPACSHLKRVHKGAAAPAAAAVSDGKPRLAVLLCMGGLESLSSEVQAILELSPIHI